MIYKNLPPPDYQMVAALTLQYSWLEADFQFWRLLYGRVYTGSYCLQTGSSVFEMVYSYICLALPRQWALFKCMLAGC